jgi:hypothetical protein
VCSISRAHWSRARQPPPVGVLLSPPLFQRVSGGGIIRKDVWGGKNGTLFPHYTTITRPVEAASDHAAIYADIT